MSDFRASRAEMGVSLGLGLPVLIAAARYAALKRGDSDGETARPSRSSSGARSLSDGTRGQSSATTADAVAVSVGSS